MFQDIILEPEQEELVIKLVEASRNLPNGKREQFHYADAQEQLIIHPGLPSGEICAYIPDLEVLERNSIISVKCSNRDSGTFDILPLGFRYYEHLKAKAGQPVQRIQSTVRDFLAADAFQETFPAAYKKWSEAEALLWSIESERQQSTIGHLCREAIQEFASALITKYNPPNVDPKIHNTIERIRAVLNHRIITQGKTVKNFLKALLSYWGEVSDLVQRQEHAGQKEGESIVWEDGRRVVFQTAVVMFEITSTLERGCD